MKVVIENVGDIHDGSHATYAVNVDGEHVGFVKHDTRDGVAELMRSTTILCRYWEKFHEEPPPRWQEVSDKPKVEVDPKDIPF